MSTPDPNERGDLKRVQESADGITRFRPPPKTTQKEGGSGSGNGGSEGGSGGGETPDR